MPSLLSSDSAQFVSQYLLRFWVLWMSTWYPTCLCALQGKSILGLLHIFLLLRQTNSTCPQQNPTRYYLIKILEEVCIALIFFLLWKRALKLPSMYPGFQHACSLSRINKIWLITHILLLKAFLFMAYSHDSYYSTKCRKW